MLAARELMAARNLHIVDVFDTGKGKTRPAFGRVSAEDPGDSGAPMEPQFPRR